MYIWEASQEIKKIVGDEPFTLREKLKSKTMTGSKVKCIWDSKTGQSVTCNHWEAVIEIIKTEGGYIDVSNYSGSERRKCQIYRPGMILRREGDRDRRKKVGSWPERSGYTREFKIRATDREDIGFRLVRIEEKLDRVLST